jgi:glycosyltransferase involved in cell wall biosynthesis
VSIRSSAGACPEESRIASTERDSFSRASAADAEPKLTVLIVVPTIDIGAAEAGAVELVRILAAAGHRPIMVASGGRMEAEIADLGVEFIRLNVASKNPLVILRNAFALARLVRERQCDVIHAHGRAPAWSAYLASRLTRVRLLTTWYKGFREQNVFKRLYNGIMVLGYRVVASSDQLAELIKERYGTPWERIVVVPASVDVEKFDPAGVSAERIEAVRRAWGVEHDTRVILVVGRMLRRKGHHLMLIAAQRLKAMGLRNFICVFEDRGGTRYAEELWDLVLATNTADVVRMVAASEDRPAVYATATVTVSAATQAEGVQRALLEAQAMGCPVLASDLGAGPEVVLTPPAVPEERMTGLRFSSGDDAALAASLIRLFSMPEPARHAIGVRGRNWVMAQFTPALVAERTLRLYADVAKGSKAV